MRLANAVSFLAKNDPRLGQVVGRQFHFHFVARHDPDEMLAHLAGNMSQDVAIPRQIDAEHRPGQHLRHRSFRHDLFFLRHEAIIGREPPVLNPVAALL